jgi:hypothetical protein
MAQSSRRRGWRLDGGPGSIRAGRSRTARSPEASRRPAAAHATAAVVACKASVLIDAVSGGKTTGPTLGSATSSGSAAQPMHPWRQPGQRARGRGRYGHTQMRTYSHQQGLGRNCLKEGLPGQGDVVTARGCHCLSHRQGHRGVDAAVPRASAGRMRAGVRCVLGKGRTCAGRQRRTARARPARHAALLPPPAGPPPPSL